MPSTNHDDSSGQEERQEKGFLCFLYLTEQRKQGETIKCSLCNRLSKQNQERDEVIV